MECFSVETETDSLRQQKFQVENSVGARIHFKTHSSNTKMCVSFHFNLCFFSSSFSVVRMAAVAAVALTAAVHIRFEWDFQRILLQLARVLVYMWRDCWLESSTHTHNGHWTISGENCSEFFLKINDEKHDRFSEAKENLWENENIFAIIFADLEIWNGEYHERWSFLRFATNLTIRYSLDSVSVFFIFRRSPRFNANRKWKKEKKNYDDDKRVRKKQRKCV